MRPHIPKTVSIQWSISLFKKVHLQILQSSQNILLDVVFPWVITPNDPMIVICNDSNALLEFGSFYNKPLWCTPTKEWFEILFWHCTDHNNSRWIDNNFFPPVTTSTQCTVSRYSNNNPYNSCCLAWHQCQRC